MYHEPIEYPRRSLSSLSLREAFGGVAAGVGLGLVVALGATADFAIAIGLGGLASVLMTEEALAGVVGTFPAVFIGLGAVAAGVPMPYAAALAGTIAAAPSVMRYEPDGTYRATKFLASLALTAAFCAAFHGAPETKAVAQPVPAVSLSSPVQ